MEELLDQHLGAGGTELVADEHIVNRRLCLVVRLGDDHALAGGEAVRLDDDGESVRRKCRLCLHGISEYFGLARRDACRVHDLLGEALGTFHARAGGDGTERLYPRLLQRVHEPDHQRGFGTDHDEVRFFRLRPSDNALDIVRLDRDTFCDLGDTGVTGRGIKLVLFRIVRKSPRNRMFTSARTDYQNLHMIFPPQFSTFNPRLTTGNQTSFRRHPELLSDTDIIALKIIKLLDRLNLGTESFGNNGQIIASSHRIKLGWSVIG